MSRQIVLRQSPVDRRQPLLSKESPPRFAEVAGGTAAGCAAICCCCPCGLVNLLVFAVVRLPAGLCRKAVRKIKKRSKKTGLLQPRRRDDDDLQIHPISADMFVTWPDKSPSVEVSNMEKEVWAKFYTTGFWRDPSESD